MPKQVYCLYRVSTKEQVEKDDIPMQRQKCHEFAAEKGWEIVREFSEKGVSGFKVSAKNRDAIQEIQKDAAIGKFDVLLVFMFDRLGRKEDETPFVVEWFIKNGIEVWSTVEGQQKIESHSDKLINYIRYWQASGESIKTSIRVKTRLGQIVQEGRFRGGTPPYGYQLIKNGRMGKKNKELYDLQINPEEAIAVRRIFELSDRYGYGGRKISTELKEEGILNLRTGQPFHYSSIQNILRNIAYVGILRSGDTQSEVFPELQIIDPSQWKRIEMGRTQRATDYYKKCGVEYERVITLEDGTETTVFRPPQITPRKNVGNALLSGNVYCGHCGGRIFASTARKSHHPTAPGTYARIPIYKCYNRTQHQERCNGPTSYRAEKVDAVITSLLKGIFEKAHSIDPRELIGHEVDASTKSAKQQLKKAKAELTRRSKELGRWSDLMLDSLDGKCAFTPEQIKMRMDTVQEAMDNLRHRIQTLQSEVSEISATTEALQEQHRQLITWAEVFDSATIEEKKMIATQLIRAVTLTRDYSIQIEFNISEAQYLGGMEMG